MNYYWLKVRFYLANRNMDLSRKFLCKLDRHIRDKFQNKFEYQTMFLLEQANFLALNKEILTAHL